MFESFHLRHIPGLFAASTMAFGGIWPMFNAQAAMLEFGLPAAVAGAPAAAPVFVVSGARTTILGVLMFLFYSRGQFDVVDSLLAVTGSYAGLVDMWVVWKQGKPSTAIFRLMSSWALAAWGLAGLTAGR